MAIEVGSILKGVVTGITKFGVFVDIEDKTGLVHISEVANTYVEDINDYVKHGQEVKVKVLNLKDGKIALSMKQAEENKPRHEHKPRHENRPRHERNSRKADIRFEDKISKFLRDSDEKLASLKKHTESKRGGRGGRRA